MPLLPRIRDADDFRRSPRDEATYRPAIEALCARHGLPAVGLRKYASGATIVFAVGERHVIKLFEPIFHEAAATERAVLERVRGRLGVPTPGVCAAGELEEWRYVVMDQLPGRSLDDAWDELSARDRLRLCRRVGEAAARLHALPADDLALPFPDWDAFLRGQADAVVERQRAQGLEERWLEQIPGFLASVELPAAAPVLMHTEIMRVHVLVRPGEGGWEVSGLFDFEPAMRGARDYELAFAGIFLSGGDPALLRAFLLGSGYAEAALTPALRRRAMAYAILHRYSILSWFMKNLPPRHATTLDALADEWFGFD